MQVFGIVGWSGSGKTVLVEKLIARFVACGIGVSTIKHAHHAFDIDRPGKDSYRHRQAGAQEVMVASRARVAMVRELRGAPEPTLDELLARLIPVDLVLVEGFKFAHHAKLEVHDPALGRPPLCRDDPHVVALACPPPAPAVAIPAFDRDDDAAIAAFVLARTGLG
ncbi:MAG: molybdopterin-guanine dinucleotide biosynthesis protein B [Alphaproteobacteria bacterium]